MGEKPIEREHRDVLRNIGQAIGHALESNAGRRMGFLLAVFPFGDDKGRFNYISNANRADIVALMKEMIAKFEGQPDIEGRA